MKLLNCFVEIRMLLRVKFMFKILFKIVLKLYNDANNKMSFLKLLIQKIEALLLKSFWRQNKMSYPISYPNIWVNLARQYDLSKLFRPITGKQKELKEIIVSKMKRIRKGIKNLPKAITFLTNRCARRLAAVEIEYQLRASRNTAI